MVIRYKYILRQSDEFYLKTGDEASVNLYLQKAPPLPCTNLCGRVISRRRGVSGATVKILNRCFKPLCHTTTDKNGNFYFTNILMPGYYEVVAAADGYTISNSCLICLIPFRPVQITIHLLPDKNAKLGTLYGITRDEKNALLPGVQVCVFDYNSIETLKAVTVSSQDGEYLFYGLKPGKYVIKAFLKGYVFPNEITLDIYPQYYTRLDIYLFKSASAYEDVISGYVTHNGNIVPYAIASLYIIENNSLTLLQVQKTNDRGFYMFCDLKPGEYVVKAKQETTLYNETIQLDEKKYLIPIDS